jgi:thymidylate synthase (FAD)
LTDPSGVFRPVVPDIDALLGVPLRVLDDGFVRVIDYMGDDTSVVQAARVSYGTGTKRVREDRGLIRYLMRHAHTTPFEMCELKLHVRAPMDVWRQWIRHRAANVNEYSTRYSVAIDAAQVTASNQWRLQTGTNKQGSAGYLPPDVGERLSAAEADLHRTARAVYEARLTAGVAREQARKDLPLSTYTEAYWKIDLHNLLHFLQLRMDSHSQQEIRTYATTIGEQIVAKWVPLVWEAFVDFRLRAVQWSRLETEIVASVIAGAADRGCELAMEAGLLRKNDRGETAPNRERAELESKLRRLGLPIPWK